MTPDDKALREAVRVAIDLCSEKIRLHEGFGKRWEHTDAANVLQAFLDSPAPEVERVIEEMEQWPTLASDGNIIPLMTRWLSMLRGKP